MSTNGQGPPSEPKRRKPGFLILSRHQQAIPIAAPGGSQDRDAVKPTQKLLLQALSKLTRDGARPFFGTRLDIAKEMEFRGTDEAITDRVAKALHGRKYREWNPETGKKDGAFVTILGLVALGYVVIVPHGHGRRELVLTQKWFGETGASCPDVAVSNTPADREPEPESVDQAAADVLPAPAIAGPTEAVPVVEPVAVAVEPTARPSNDVLQAVLGRYAFSDRASQAQRLLKRLGDQCVKIVSDGAGGIALIPFAGASLDEVMDENTKEVYEWLKPELVELVNAKPKSEAPTPPDAGPTPAGKTIAPAVANPKAFREMIRKLTEEPAADDSDCQALAVALVNDPGFQSAPQNREKSKAYFAGMARDTKQGLHPPVVMHEAFEAAVEGKVSNRGALFVTVANRELARKRDTKGVPS